MADNIKRVYDVEYRFKVVAKDSLEATNIAEMLLSESDTNGRVHVWFSADNYYKTQEQ